MKKAAFTSRQGKPLLTLGKLQPLRELGKVTGLTLNDAAHGVGAGFNQLDLNQITDLRIPFKPHAGEPG